MSSRAMDLRISGERCPTVPRPACSSCLAATTPGKAHLYSAKLIDDHLLLGCRVLLQFKAPSGICNKIFYLVIRGERAHDHFF